jgi:hypothetical protein
MANRRGSQEGRRGVVRKAGKRCLGRRREMLAGTLSLDSRGKHDHV